MSFTNRTSQAVLNSVFGNTSNFGALASAPDLHLAASTTAPAEDGTNFTEPGGGVGYARVDVANTDFNAATLADPSVVDNSGVIAFPQATGSWGTITHVGLFDALTAGNLVAFYALSSSKAIESGDTLQFAAGDLDLDLD